MGKKGKKNASKPSRDGAQQVAEPAAPGSSSGIASASVPSAEEYQRRIADLEEQVRLLKTEKERNELRSQSWSDGVPVQSNASAVPGNTTAANGLGGNHTQTIGEQPQPTRISGPVRSEAKKPLFSAQNVLQEGQETTLEPPRDGAQDIETASFTDVQDDPNELVHLFIDNSNVWIEAKKTVPILMELEVPELSPLRIDYGKLVDVVLKKRQLAKKGVLVGSEPPSTDTLWQKFERKNLKVITHKRNSLNEEKGVDVELATQAGLVIGREQQKGTILVIAGDGDYLPVVNAAFKNGWKAECWFWFRKAPRLTGLYKLKFESARLRFNLADVNLIAVELRTLPWHISDPTEQTWTLVYPSESKRSQAKKLLKRKGISGVVDV
ncbi:hypothetical protein HDU93_004167 [Gonapodya sp. JEL0774]|nr:hypothetical protein HDU93_004167 [Gonapodya sp. JEL0774]